MNDITFKLCKGTWSWWVRDKNTHEKLSVSSILEVMKDDTEVTFDEALLHGNKDAGIYIERIR